MIISIIDIIAPVNYILALHVKEKLVACRKYQNDGEEKKVSHAEILLTSFKYRFLRCSARPVRNVQHGRLKKIDCLVCKVSMVLVFCFFVQGQPPAGYITCADDGMEKWRVQQVFTAVVVFENISFPSHKFKKEEKEDSPKNENSSLKIDLMDF